jgi:copper transport outer membrane protein MctB
MFDFRYHALSLVAVFLALMIGLLLGVAIGDQGLVSSAERNVRDSLRKDVRQANARSADLRRELRARDRVDEGLYPLLVEDRLAGRRIGLIGLGDLPDSTIAAVRDALSNTGGRLSGVAVVGEPVPEGAARSVKGASDPPSNADYNKLGEQLGAALVSGGKRARTLGRSVLNSSSGRLDGLDGVVIYHAPRDLTGDDAAHTDAFESGLVSGFTTDETAEVTGVEETDTEPSQIQWFKDHRLPSVDNVDTLAGKAALVFVLLGANGSYGEKDSAQALLPNSAGGGP